MAAPDDSSDPATDDAPPPPQQGSRDPTGDVMLGALLGLIALFVVVESWRMPLRGPLGFATSPGFVPLLVGATALVLCCVLVLINLRRGGLAGMAAWWRDTGAREETRRLVVLIALITAYVLSLPWLPFIVATFLFLMAVFVFLRAAPWWLMPIYAGAAAYVVADLLPRLFEMRLP